MAATLNINFIIAVNPPGWVARDRSAGNLSLKKPPKTVRHGFTFPIRASDSCRKLLTAEIVRQNNAWSTARVLECSDRFYPFHSLKSGKNNFSLYTICVEFPFSMHAVLNWTLRVELFILSTLSSRVLYRLCSVLFWIVLKTHWLNVNWTLLKLYKVFLFIFSSLVFSHYGR